MIFLTVKKKKYEGRLKEKKMDQGSEAIKPKFKNKAGMFILFYFILALDLVCKLLTWLILI